MGFSFDSVSAGEGIMAGRERSAIVEQAATAGKSH
jgi:hypothetical protein